VVKVDEDDIYGFSSNMRYVIRKSKAVFQKEDGKQNLALILDGNDSLVRIQKIKRIFKKTIKINKIQLTNNNFELVN
jgi:hypothetical protein